MKECRNCKHFNKLYTLEQKKPLKLKYEGVGRCMHKSGEQSGYILADFRECKKFSVRKIEGSNTES